VHPGGREEVLFVFISSTHSRLGISLEQTTFSGDTPIQQIIKETLLENTDIELRNMI
jgi:hypothetical protein